jgi:N-acetylmuramoyl-L-alanine amidase
MPDDLPHFIDDDSEKEQPSAFPPSQPSSEEEVVPIPSAPIGIAFEAYVSEPEPLPTVEPEKLSDDPQFVDEIEEDVEHFLRITREDPPPTIQPKPLQPPAPETQSTFVNPAMARIAAARPRQQPQEPSEMWLALRTLVIVTSAAVIVAFIFNYWTPDSFLSQKFVASLQEVNSTQGPPTAIPSPLPTFDSIQKVGIITGHSGPSIDPTFEIDPGAVCDENFDGTPELTELDINTSVAQRVAQLLIQAGYQVEMLNEWDPRIQNFRASALVSIHTNTCENLGFGATGFNVQAYERSPMIDRDAKLRDCVVATYANATGLPRHFGSPPDLTDYHAFREVSLDTPTIIVELGFMFADRPLLTQQPDAMARGIFEGIDCFLNPQQAASPIQLTPTPES